MRLGKEYHWEMGHRLPFHEAGCKNLHGHTYKMIVEVKGSINEQGMIIDFYELDRIINPIVEQLDHSFLVSEKDKPLLKFLEDSKSKYNVIENHSTAENICQFIITKLSKSEFPNNIDYVKVRLYETNDAYVEGIYYFGVPC